jgi:hypothetical protein
MSVISNNQLAGAAGQGGADAGYTIQRSLRFNSGDSAHLSRTPSSAGNRRTWTWSGWVKRSTEGNVDHVFNATGYSLFYFFSDHKLDFDGGGTGAFSTARAFRDFSAWYHIVLAFDTTQATASNRIKLWVNGEQIQDWDSITYPAQNADGGINSTGVHKIGHWNTQYSNFYLADVHFIDGQALAPTDFGEYDDNNVWQAKEYTHNVPTNVNTGTISATAAGWQSLNNSLDGSTSNKSPSNNNTAGTITFGSQLYGVTSVRAYTRFYSGGTARLYHNGSIVHQTGTINNNNATQWYDIYSGPEITIDQYWQQMSNGSSDDFWALEINGVVVTASANGGNLTSTIPVAGANSFHLDFSDNSSNAALGYDAAVEAPTVNPDGGFDVVTYSGNSGTQSISSLNFQPDFVWIKNSNGGHNHMLFDAVRGAGADLQSNSTASEGSAGSNDLTSFDANGFSLGSNNAVNQSGRTYVGWAWKAGGTAVSNTDGTITSQVSANTTYGFSIVTYSGTLSNTPNPAPTVGHGLNAAPQLIISKSLNPNGDDGGSWYVNHTYNYDNWYRLNLTNAGQSIAASGGGTTVDPTSSVFSTYFIAGSNCNNNNYVAY